MARTIDPLRERDAYARLYARAMAAGDPEGMARAYLTEFLRLEDACNNPTR